MAKHQPLLGYNSYESNFLGMVNLGFRNEYKRTVSDLLLRSMVYMETPGTSIIERAHGQTGVMEGITVQFDAAFDKRNSRSASGLVVRDQMGALKASKTVLHENIPSLVGKMMIHRAIDLEGRWREN